MRKVYLAYALCIRRDIHNERTGAVELPLFCAQVFDTDLQGQEYWIAGCPANDPRAQFWERRRHCYELVLDSLLVFEERCVPGKQSAGQIDDPDTVRGHAYELAFACEDEMFHSTLYEWLISRGMADELLEVRTRNPSGSHHVLTSHADATRIP